MVTSSMFDGPVKRYDKMHDHDFTNPFIDMSENGRGQIVTTKSDLEMSDEEKSALTISITVIERIKLYAVEHISRVMTAREQVPKQIRENMFSQYLDTLSMIDTVLLLLQRAHDECKMTVLIEDEILRAIRMVDGATAVDDVDVEFSFENND